MKIILIVCLLFISCTKKKELPLDEEIIMSRLLGEKGAKKWKEVRSIDLKHPEEEDKKTKKCQQDDEVEYLQEGYFVYRVNEKCSQYDHDHAVRWRLKESEGKFYIEYFDKDYKSTEFRARAQIEKITFDELVIKYLKNEESKKEKKNGDWYVQRIPIPGDFDYTMEFKHTK